MRANLTHKREAVPDIRGRPLLVVICTTCDAMTVARSPSSATVRGWLLPDPWPRHLPQWSRVSAQCPDCLHELPPAD